MVTDLVVPTENLLYTVLNGQVHQWDIRTEAEVSLNIESNVQSISWSVLIRNYKITKIYSSSAVGPNFLATGSENGQVALWDIRHSTLPIYQYDKHVKAVRR